MNNAYKDNLMKFANDPQPGQYLVFQEYFDSHGGGQYPVVDVVSFSEDIMEDPCNEDCGDPRLREIQGWCDSSGYDGIVTLELWDNGEAYLSGDGVNHPRYRVTGMESVSISDCIEDDELTDMSGVPHYWGPWMQDYCDDKPGIKVEYYLKVYQNGQWHWPSCKEFARTQEEVDELVAFARAELNKPKYYGLHTKVVVGGNVVFDSQPLTK